MIKVLLLQPSERHSLPLLHIHHSSTFGMSKNKSRYHTAVRSASVSTGFGTQDQPETQPFLKSA